MSTCPSHHRHRESFRVPATGSHPHPPEQGVSGGEYSPSPRHSGLCAGPRPRPARGTSVQSGGGGVLGSFMRAPLEIQSPAHRRESPGLQRPASPRTRRHQDPSQGCRHPGTSQARSGPSPKHCPSSSLCGLRPEARRPFKKLASEVGGWQDLLSRGECVFAFLSASIAVRVR